MSIIPTLRDSLIVNDTRRFICRLRYNESTQNFYNRIEGKGINSPRDLHLTLRSAHDHNSHVFRDLYNRVNQIETPLFDPVKQVWNQFYQCVQRGNPDEIWDSYRIFSSSFPINEERLNEFKDTDLILCEEGVSDPLPLVNLIRKSEIDSLLGKYFEFVRRLKIDSSSMPQLDPSLFNEQLKRDVRMLLSVPLGRQLIDRIMEKMKPETKITIIPSNRFYYTKVSKTKSKPDSHRIEYSVNPTFFYQELPVEGLRSLSSPPFIVLAHELLHLVHMMEGTFSHDFNPLLDRELETNEEERHVIRNAQCCYKHEPDPCNEETLRTQLGLPVRVSHLAGCKPTDPVDEVYARALKVGAKKDAEAAFERGVSGPVVAQHMHVLSPATVHKFRQLAAVRPECRTGPFDPAAPQPIPVISIPLPQRQNPLSYARVLLPPIPGLPPPVKSKRKKASAPVTIPQEARVAPPKEKKRRAAIPPGLTYVAIPLKLLPKIPAKQEKKRE